MHHIKTLLVSLLCSRFFGCHATLGERCVTSKKTPAKEANYWSEEKQTTIIHIHLVFTYCCAGGRINEVCPVATCQ